MLETVLSGFDGQFQRFPALGSRGNKERGVEVVDMEVGHGK